MPPKKNNDNFWQIIISSLLFILIILIIFLIYIYYQKETVVNKSLKYNKRDTQNDNVIIIKENKESIKDIPIYPKELPKYNNTSYQQVGILTSDETDKDPIVLPLFSKKIHNRNDRWNYYTATDQNNMMRLPITFDNISCDDDIGCREIYNNDKINIEIYKGRIFTATIYKVDVPQYFAENY